MTSASPSVEPSAGARRTSLAGLRLRLKPGHRTCGHVQGAWWPRSTMLDVELPSLVAALELRYGAISSVQYHGDDWFTDQATASLGDSGVDITDSAQSRHVVSVTGPRMGRLDILVVPPYTDAEHAYEIVRVASTAADTSTPEQLLGPHARGTIEVRAAMQRWDGEGGSLPRTSGSFGRAQQRTPRPRAQLVGTSAVAG